MSSTTIWSFWDGPECDVVLRCIESIRLCNPSRPVIVLNKDTLFQFLDPIVDFPQTFNGKRWNIHDFERVQYLADWVRLVLLEKYGGVWLDASIIATNPVETWIVSSSHSSSSSTMIPVTMFSMHANDKVHGNWALAAPAGHPVIRAWRKELANIFQETGPRQMPTCYIQRAFEQYPNLVELWNKPEAPPLPYLWVYLAFQVVLQRNPGLKSSIFLRSSSNNGPMYRRYLCNIVQNERDPMKISEKCAQHLATRPLSTHDHFFIKLVGMDREPVRTCLEKQAYVHGSVLDMLAKFKPRSIVYGRDLHTVSTIPTLRSEPTVDETDDSSMEEALEPDELASERNGEMCR